MRRSCFVTHLSATGRSHMVVALLYEMQTPCNCFTLCRCTKRGVHFSYPYNSARAFRATDATTGMSPESLPHGGSGLKGDSLRRCGASRHGNGLAGFAKTAPGKDLAGGVRFVPFALCGLGLGVVLLLSSFGLTLAHLPCLAQCGGVRGSDCPCTVIRGTKSVPLFLYTNRSPQAWATSKRNRVVGLGPKMVRGQAGRFLPR